MAWKSRKVEPQAHGESWDELDIYQQQAVLNEMSQIVSELQANQLLRFEANSSFDAASELRPARAFQRTA